MNTRLANLLCWLGIFLASAGLSSIIIATRVHAQIIKPFGEVAPKPLPVCWSLQDSFDVSVGHSAMWMQKVSEGKCAIVTFPWFYSRTMLFSDNKFVAEVQVKNGQWFTMFALFGDLNFMVEA